MSLPFTVKNRAIKTGTEFCYSPSKNRSFQNIILMVNKIPIWGGKESYQSTEITSYFDFDVMVLLVTFYFVNFKYYISAQKLNFRHLINAPTTAHI
jgi:hypothetical protein